jgi:hypothetical protein
MSKTDTPKLTNASNKATLLENYNRVAELLKEERKKNLNPTAIKKAKRATEVITKSNGLSTDSIEKSIQQVEKRTLSLMSDIKMQVSDELDNLKTVQEAIKTQEEVLEDIYGIERQAESLAALIRVQEERRVEFDAELAKARVEFDNRIVEEEKAHKEKMAEYERAFSLKVKLAEQEQERKNQDFKYNFERQEKERTDAIQDELTTQRKIFADYLEKEKKALGEREELVAKQEEEVTTLRTQVDAIPTQIEEARAAGKADAGKSHGFETRAIKSTFEAEMAVLGAKVDSLTGERDRLVEELDVTKSKLDEAYAKVQDVAVQALTAQGNANTVAQVQAGVAAASAGKR